MKRFLLFAGDHYYPEGGWYDLNEDFDTLSDACLAGVVLLDTYRPGKGGMDWFQVVDNATGDLVFTEDGPFK